MNYFSPHYIFYKDHSGFFEGRSGSRQVSWVTPAAFHEDRGGLHKRFKSEKREAPSSHSI